MGVVSPSALITKQIHLLYEYCGQSFYYLMAWLQISRIAEKEVWPWQRTPQAQPTNQPEKNASGIWIISARMHWTGTFLSNYKRLLFFCSKVHSPCSLVTCSSLLIFKTPVIQSYLPKAMMTDRNKTGLPRCKHRSGQHCTSNFHCSWIQCIPFVGIVWVTFFDLVFD